MGREGVATFLRARPLWMVGAVFLVAFSLVLGALEWRNQRAGDGFDLVRWEISSVPNKWLFALGSPFRDDPHPDEAIARYFALTPDERAEAGALENVVEAAIEGRLDAALKDLGVRDRLPVPGILFPPVDIELAASPSVLVLSPRSHIERVGDSLLRPDVVVPRMAAIEQSAEARNESISALVVQSGGVATYPAIVGNDSSYAATLSTAAHEWVHHYLAFYPLGAGYFSSVEQRTINETVADVVGREVAAVVLERWGDPSTPALVGAPAASEVRFNAVDVLRVLRLEVDALLAEERVTAAEERMDAARRDLAAGGVDIRRINQAYFAWYGTYAARADSIDPLGPQVREIRSQAGSLPRFLELVRDARTRADIESLLLHLQGIT
ncbi:MAG: hypothetical protein GEU80_10805 [Dehalococcoidia bacterium]|nr:hypothetical protein [Dehalococcoidia bacterium]